MTRARAVLVVLGAWIWLAASLPAHAQQAQPPYRDDLGFDVPSDPVTSRAPTTFPPQSGADVRAGVGQYSAPEWLPLRADALIGCVYSNCDGPYHNYWALDLLDPQNQPGDPIYAAGAGQAHILQRGTACGPSLDTPANLVSVDHGGGVVTWYAHLDQILISENQWVDQNTQLGTMGATGYTNPCPTNHLHFEKQVNGTRVDPGPLKACHGSALVQYPQAVGYQNWNDVPPFQKHVSSDGTTCGGPTIRHQVADFDGNGTTDISVFRPSNGVWYTANPASSLPFGTSGDIPVPGDYDGDGNTDQAVFRPSTGVWYLNSSPPTALPFGTSNDIPVPADYNGDGKTDVAVFRPSEGVWYIQNPAQAVAFGTNGDIPVPGDYNGDGKAELAVFRPSTGVWYISGPSPSSTVFGTNGDIPVPGDYNGDGKTDIAVYRPSTGVWYVQNPAQAVAFGASGDQPQPGDYNGDGKTDIAVYRPSTGVWYVQNPAQAVVFGATGDIPLPLPNAIRRFFF